MPARKRSRSHKRKPRRRGRRALLRFGWLVPLGAVLVGIGVLVLTYAFASIPLPEDIAVAGSAEVYDRNGVLIGSYSGDEQRFIIDTEQLLEDKPFIGQAVVAAEDRDFYSHNGVSIRGIMRAAWANLTGGEIQQGGSTITQQYVKNAVLHDSSRTISRKAKEAILAIKLERRFSKKEILGFYLNTIYLGRGAYGIEAAARVYFDRSADELTLDQAAFLAGIIPAPESYQPDENRNGARDRRDRVLDLMVSEGYISATRAARAARGRVRVAEGAEGRETTQRAAYFMEWLRKEYLYPEYGNDLYTRGLKIHTTLDLELQSLAEDSIESILTEEGDPQASLVTITPTGAVRAFVGGRAYRSVEKAQGFNFASDAPGRHGGSSFKPFTLLTAIEEGISPLSRFSGASPRDIDECAGENGVPPWEVDNYGGSSYGTLTLDQATTNSVNTIFAQLIAAIGPEKVASLVEDFGFEPLTGGEEIEPNCSLALGGFNVTPVEMARAYAGFAGRGAVPEVMPISYIVDATGECIKEYRPDEENDCTEEDEPEIEQVVERNSADVLTEVLTHVVEGGTATAANIGRPVAGKTGTSQNNRDAWFAGYVPQLATVVWIGYPRQDSGVVPEMRYCSDLDLCRPVHGITATGGSFPAQIWAAFMSQATASMPVLEFPEPSDLPDEIINSPAPVVATPSATATKKPKPTEEPTPTPTEVPTPTPTDDPNPGPTVIPTPTQGGGGNEEDDP